MAESNIPPILDSLGVNDDQRAPNLTPGPTTGEFDFDPNMFGGGDFDFDFMGMDFEDADFHGGMNQANFGFEAAFMEAALSLGPHETTIDNPQMSTWPLLPEACQFESQDIIPLPGPIMSQPTPSATNEWPLILPPIPNPTVDASIVANQETANNADRVLKHKKAQEVDEKDILPEGSHRSRNKSARARGFEKSL